MHVGTSVERSPAMSLPVPDSLIPCPVRGTTDPELCFSCSAPCALAEVFTGRSPDRDVEFLRKFGPGVFQSW